MQAHLSYRLAYRHFRPVLHMHRIGPTNGFGSVLCGSFRETEELLDTPRRENSFQTAVEWFVNMDPSEDEPKIEKFTETYGLLRWGWTHEGQGGSKSDQFEMPISGFKESQEELRQYWDMAQNRRSLTAVISWLSQQLGSESPVTDVATAEEMWKLSHPRTGVHVRADKAGVEVRLVLGDLWQAMCYQLLELVVQKQGAIGICANEFCGERYFIKRGRQLKFCSPLCAKRTNDRVSAWNQRHPKRRR